MIYCISLFVSKPICVFKACLFLCVIDLHCWRKAIKSTTMSHMSLHYHKHCPCSLFWVIPTHAVVPTLRINPRHKIVPNKCPIYTIYFIENWSSQLPKLFIFFKMKLYMCDWFFKDLCLQEKMGLGLRGPNRGGKSESTDKRIKALLILGDLLKRKKYTMTQTLSFKQSHGICACLITRISL